MKGLCRATLAILVIAACGRDGGITDPSARDALLAPPGVIALGVDSTTGASIETNKDDYAPGEIVHLEGRGWAPGETVNLHMTEEPNTHADVDTSVVADAAGGFSIHFYDVQSHDLGVTFTLTATGQTSGSRAVATFTDGTANVDIAPSYYPNGAGAVRRFSVLVRNTSGAGPVCVRVTVPSGYTGVALASFSVAQAGWTSNVSGNVITLTGGTQLSAGTGNWARLEVDAVPPAASTNDWVARVADNTGCTTNASSRDAAILIGAAAPRTYTADFRTSGGVLIPSETGTAGVSKTFRLRLTNTSSSSTGDKAIYGVIALPSCFGSPAVVAVTSNGNDASWNSEQRDNVIRLSNGELEKGLNQHVQVEFTTIPQAGCAPIFHTALWNSQEHSSGEGSMFTISGAHPSISLVAANVASTIDAGGPYSGAEGSAITLSGATASDPDAGDVLTYKWTVNTTGIDANGSCTFTPNNTVLNPSVTCTDDSQDAVGTKFTLTLEVKDGAGGHTVTDNADLTVTNVAPTATISAPSPVNPGQTFTVSLNGGSDAGTNDNPDLQYAFDCGDGAGYNAFGPSNSRSCTANQPNSQTVKGKIRDQDLGENEYQTTVSVNNAAPVARAGGPYTGSEGSAVSLNGTGSTDSDGTIATYAWTYAVVTADAGASCVITNPSSATASITCDDDGSFTATLTVTDDDGASHSNTAALTLSNANPTANAGGPYSGAEGSAIQLTASGNDPGDNDDAALTYAWTINSIGIDGGGTCSLSSASIQNPTVTCTDDSNAGNFTVSVTVSDGDGGSATASANLTVTNANPVANAGGPYTGAEATAIQLNASGDDPGNNDDAGLTYAWSINTTGIDAGGQCTLSNANIKNPTVTCDDDSGAGTFTVSVTVSDDDGGSHTDGAALTVTNANPTANAAGPYSGVEGSAIQLTGSGDDPAANDDGSLTYLWSVNTATMDNGAACAFSPSASSQNPTVTCTDDTNGSPVSLTLKVMDDDGGQGTQSVNLTVTNANPNANPGGPYSGNEGSAIQLSGSGDDPGNNDDPDLTYQWSVSSTGIDAGGSCALSSATAQNPTVTCTDDSNGSTFTVSLTVKDDDGGTSTTQSANLTVANVNPTSDAGGPYSGNEGSAVAISGSKGDQGPNDTHTSAWSYTAGAGVDGGTTCSFTNAAALSTSVTCTDDGTFTLTLTITDDDGGVGTSTATLTVSNVAPVITTVNTPIAPVAAGTNNVTVTWNFTDPGTETWTCSMQWDVGQSFEPATYVNPKSCSATKTLPPGLYTVTVKVDDNDGGEDSRTVLAYIVVYDPNGGFVTGGGWIMSPPGAYVTDPTLTGKANFGFVAKYQQGRTLPQGNTEFQFHAGNLNFSSTVYEWLVVAGTRAQFKGDGTINGVGGYGFLLTAIDGSPDRFRIKIVNKTTGAVVYDNQPGALDDSAAATDLGGGSIVIHTKK